MIPNIINKISDQNYANVVGNKDLIIQIDGGVTPESIPLMINAGADALVCGTEQFSDHTKIQSQIK